MWGWGGGIRLNGCHIRSSGVSQPACGSSSPSRTVVNRLLDDKDTGGTMTTLIKAGLALGMSWTLQADSDSERAKHCVGKTGTDLFSAIEAVLICPCLVLSL
jgi:hypothetical protein